MSSRPRGGISGCLRTSHRIRRTTLAAVKEHKPLLPPIQAIVQAHTLPRIQAQILPRIQEHTLPAVGERHAPAAEMAAAAAWTQARAYAWMRRARPSAASPWPRRRWAGRPWLLEDEHADVDGSTMTPAQQTSQCPCARCRRLFAVLCVALCPARLRIWWSTFLIRRWRAPVDARLSELPLCALLCSCIQHTFGTCCAS